MLGREKTNKQKKKKPVVLVVKNSPANAGDTANLGSIPESGKICWRTKWQPTPVFLPGESHGHRSLVGYSPCVCKRLVDHGVTERA